MALADDLKPLLRVIRAIPGQLGLRPHRVYLRRGAMLGSSFGGDVWPTDTEIVEGDNQPPKVRQLNDERLALGGLAQGSLEIGPITTPHGDVGITMDDLKGAELGQYDTLFLLISGPHGDAVYAVKGLTVDRSMHWKIIASPIAQAP